MDSKSRRDKILKKLQDRTAPISAVRLADDMGVSRQVIVSDVALLRAEGHEIIATSRGYMIAPVSTGKYVRKIACKHSREDTARELFAIVTLGGEILDVIVNHPHYGDLSGQLNIKTVEDVRGFAAQVDNNEKLLSDLTDGTHLHTIACKDKESFDKILAELNRLGMLLENNSEV